MKSKSHFFKYMLLSFLLLSLVGCAQHTIKTTDTSLIFQYRDDRATEIFLATSLDNFQYHSASKKIGGQWVVRLPLEGEFTYFYIVDGQVRLPHCPETVLDDFGSKNCFYRQSM